MNKIESIVYNLVRKNPALKQSIRNLYQSIFDLLPRQKEMLNDRFSYKEGYFFGFHDISPLSKDETKLLASKLYFDLRMPMPDEGLEVGFFDFREGEIGQWHSIGKSYAWNYHKGCRLQWLDETKIIYNTSINGNLKAVIVDTISLEEIEIPYPIDSLYKDSKVSLATTFNYDRLERCMPGYGYNYKEFNLISESAPDNTGLSLINLDTKSCTLLLSLKDIAIQVTGKVESEYFHFVTHTEFSQDGRYISFLYRRIPKEGDYMKRRSVICVYDLQKNKLIVLPSQESGSHYVWNSKNQLVASVNIDGRNCHALFSPENSLIATPIVPERINSDGHQSFIDDISFVTDTYPDRRRMASLYKVDMLNNKVDLLAKLYSPKQFQTKDFQCHIACDLHPRVIGNGKWVCFDSARTGKRGIYVMPLLK